MNILKGSTKDKYMRKKADIAVYIFLPAYLPFMLPPFKIQDIKPALTCQNVYSRATDVLVAEDVMRTRV